MAEEEQAATKAAAKKAKKQRQKPKAKKQAQPEPSAPVAESHVARIPSDEAQPLSAESSQLSMDLSQLSSSAGEHRGESFRAHNYENQQQQQQQQQQLDEANGTSLSALGDAAVQETRSGDVAIELEGLHLPSCDQAANKAHTDADFLQQLFCCPLTKVSHVVAILDRQVFICSVAVVQQQCNAWLAGSQHQEQLSSAAHAYFTILLAVQAHSVEQPPAAMQLLVEQVHDVLVFVWQETQ